MQIFIKCCCIILLFTVVSSEIVEIDDGKIEGTILKSRLGDNFFAFFRIPYAKPPLGDLRFQAPQPAEKWNYTLDGREPGPICFQQGHTGMSEDCLQLNVFTKSFTELKPVIFSIHGGGFEVGCAFDQGPLNLIDRDVVIVSINYRLGPFGFLGLGTKEVPGNAGMKDQVLALKWVQKNIYKFGGDKNKVTIAGYSAGSFSVTAHMASTMSKGLFHRAIAMSGSITTAMPLKENNIEIAEKIGKSLNCNPEKLLDCLINAPPKDIADVVVKEYPVCEVVIWMPVVEKDFGQERFFSEDPAELFRSGRFNRVPVIVGRTTDEFISTVPGLLKSPKVKELNDDFNRMAPYCFFYQPMEQKTKDSLSKALRKAFLPVDPIDVRSFNGLNYLFGDGIIGYPVHRFVQLVTNFTEVYYYKFSFIGKYGYKYPNDKPYGVNHGDDLKYSFNNGPLIESTDPESFMVKRMTRIFEYFALNGNPNYNVDLFKWPKHEASSEFYMDIGTYMVEKNGLFLERYAIWDKNLSKRNLDQKNYMKSLRKKLILAKLDMLELYLLNEV